MAVKLGSSAVTLKLGTQSVTGYLGDTIVTATVPGAPTITSATYSSEEGLTNIIFSAPESDGGSAVTSYVFYVVGFEDEPDSVVGTLAQYYSDKTGQVVQIAAVNAIGEGPKSEPVTITAA